MPSPVEPQFPRNWICTKLDRQIFEKKISTLPKEKYCSFEQTYRAKRSKIGHLDKKVFQKWKHKLKLTILEVIKNNIKKCAPKFLSLIKFRQIHMVFDIENLKVRFCHFLTAPDTSGLYLGIHKIHTVGSRIVSSLEQFLHFYVL